MLENILRPIFINYYIYLHSHAPQSKVTFEKLIKQRWGGSREEYVDRSLIGTGCVNACPSADENINHYVSKTTHSVDGSSTFSPPLCTWKMDESLHKPLWSMLIWIFFPPLISPVWNLTILLIFSKSQLFILENFFMIFHTQSIYFCFCLYCFLLLLWVCSSSSFFKWMWILSVFNLNYFLLALFKAIGFSHSHNFSRCASQILTCFFIIIWF